MASRSGRQVRGWFSVPATHASLPGHFPGHPVVPGVVLLDHVLGLIFDGSRGAVLLDVKFLAPVGPDQAIRVDTFDLATTPPGRIGFAAAARDGQTVLRGTVEMGSW